VQTLSAVATKTANYVKQLDGLNTKLLDTRKTLPGYVLLKNMQWQSVVVKIIV
jgi:nicotinate-nucleotide pyrophosphorylase